ncbi:TIGR03620 family F420-dependent LLM class oxidoreductase [Streptomyces phaeochromogenes]|uniref:TIGR03620 family F420-dependent LLM class oxidoreductase n=1 Tax=Streptomyces phaeochromogenes TaxID=1923 RepID=UPI002DDA1583|nr:TIGR03620 family F420-dependent LLM class oxidoreductase [Streptomyces phaeochromogenes]WRZ34507.1 TIGR03620 family F420-dependent LLM class oxidoreductase [Streptomyces phaeochromogenes]
MSLTGTGVWAWQLRRAEPHAIREAATELEHLGFSALWIPDVGGDVFSPLSRLLDATTAIPVGTAVLNLWKHEAEEVAAFRASLGTRANRLLLGIGASHAAVVDRKSPGRFRRPLQAMDAYLDQLDAAEPPVQRGGRLLAALGPKMIELARLRSAGVITYLCTPRHTELARAALGPESTLVAEQAVVLESDPARARGLARRYLDDYLALPNYRNNLERLGFTAEDFADGFSDGLVDALVAWGDPASIAKRLDEHRTAGADHVCVQILTAAPERIPMDELRSLAPAFE